MRRIVGYQDGRPIWSENQPASAAFIPYGDRVTWGAEDTGLGVVGGAPVIGQSDAELHREQVARYKAKVKAAKA